MRSEPADLWLSLLENHKRSVRVFVSPLAVSPAGNMLLLLLLLLSSTDDGRAQRVTGQKKNGICSCEVNSTVWSFPAGKFEAVLDQVETCEVSLSAMLAQVKVSSERLPRILAEVTNVAGRLQPFQYLHHRGLYTALSLRLLGQELSQLETDVEVVHNQLNNAETQRLSKEVVKLRQDVTKMKMSDTINMKAVKEKLRYLKNSVGSCKSIPTDFRGFTDEDDIGDEDDVAGSGDVKSLIYGQYRGRSMYCLKGLITNISEPITTKVGPHGKSYTSGSWGKQAQMDGEGQQNTYWVQPLLSSHIWGNTLRVYQTYGDLMGSTKHKDFTFASSYTDPKTIEGPSAVLYGDALYYHCYRSADVCRYDLNTNLVKRVTLPGTGVGFNNKFPYCYYDCRLNSDVDVEVDETGLWAIYATIGNHGNLVVSQLVWNAEAQTLNVTQTWETRMFKKAVSNAFVACGVLYATRYVDEHHEEVFYAFDTATGKEDNSLALPLEKVAKGVASLSYNPTDRQIYMYNDGYLLAYQALF